MSSESKNNNNLYSDYIRYRRNEMTAKERNEFERMLQKDPFAEEAVEGFEQTDPLLAGEDISELRMRLTEKTKERKSFIWYRIAASVAFLVILASILIVTNRKEPSEQIAYAPEATQKAGELITADTDKTDREKGPAKPIQKIPESVMPLPSEELRLPDILEKKQQMEETKDSIPAAVQYQKPVVAAAERETRDEIGVAEGKAADLIRARKAAEYISRVSGRVISSEDNLPIPGASITVKGTARGTLTDSNGNFSFNLENPVNKVLVADFVGMVPKEFTARNDTTVEIKLDPSLAALSEIVVVGYGAANEEKGEIASYTPPSPSIGKRDFDRYIQDNIRRPDSATEGQRVVVVLNFNVTSDGRIDSIKVVRSPGRLFSDEAIRLIKEGPSWLPAEENGKTIPDNVRMRIVFR